MEQDNIVWHSERNELLKQHLSKLNRYELERLRQCFEREYQYHPENKSDIDNIIAHIDMSLNE